MNTFLFTRLRKLSNIFLLVFAITIASTAIGQQAKGPLQLAEQYFAEGEYYTAAYLYEQYLHPPKKQKTISEFPLNAKGRRALAANKAGSTTDILYKQAESYRMANYWNEAENTYKKCIEKDSVQYIDAYYWKAVCERSLGNYAAAQNDLEKYLQFTTVNKEFKTEAEKELQTIQYIKQQQAKPDSILFTVQKLTASSSSERGLFAISPYNSNTFLISSTQADTSILAGVNPNRSRLFYATLNNGSFINMTPLGISDTDPVNNQGAASISADGKYLYFTQWKKEKGQTVSSIYFAKKQADDWSTPTLLTSINSNGFNSKQPFCTPDGKYIYFSSDRPGGSGSFDIWYAPLNNDGTTGTPVNAGAMVNTSGNEQAPFYHNSSSALVFSSDRKGGMGGYDLFAAKGSPSGWNVSENLGHPVNSSRDDIYFFAKEGAPLLQNAIFSSDRGQGCCLETYTVTKAPKNKKLTGTIYDCQTNTPLAEAQVTLTDISGKTWKATTGTNGKYSFDLLKEMYQNLYVTVSKETYIDTLTAFQTTSTDESDMLLDVLTNADVCIQKKPEPPKLVIKAEDVVTVFFDFDRSNLKAAAINKLDSIYNILTEFPAATIQISGYTDGLGSDEYNKILSDKRAKACADYLIKKGIDSNRITFESFGACCPVEMEIINGRDNAEGRSRNRRALINVKKE